MEPHPSCDTMMKHAIEQPTPKYSPGIHQGPEGGGIENKEEQRLQRRRVAGPVYCLHQMTMLHGDIIPDNQAGSLEKFCPVRTPLKATKRALMNLNGNLKHIVRSPPPNDDGRNVR